MENCGFGCSYCSIQSFYHDGEIHFDSRFADKLDALDLDNEEHLTAPLDERLAAARRVADQGILVGFHFHPMVH